MEQWYNLLRYTRSAALLSSAADELSTLPPFNSPVVPCKSTYSIVLQSSSNTSVHCCYSCCYCCRCCFRVQPGPLASAGECSAGPHPHHTLLCLPSSQTTTALIPASARLASKARIRPTFAAAIAVATHLSTPLFLSLPGE